jgi:hypothetical protein
LTRRIQLLLLVSATGLLLGGCGEDKAKTFKLDFRPLNAKIVALGRDVGTAVTGASGRSDVQIQTEFAALAKRTGTLRKQVDDLDPPDELKDDTGDLVSAMGSAQKSLNQISAAAKKHDPDAARRATIQLVADSDELRSSRRRVAEATRGSS